MNTTTTKSKAPIILGVLSVITWLLPIIGVPVSIAGIVVSAKKGSVHKLGLILSILGIILSIINAALGVYLKTKGIA